MITIDDHTFDQNLLNNGWVIDAGCRGFNLTNYCLKQRGCNVFALDIEDFSESEEVSLIGKYYQKFIFRQAALSNVKGETECYLFGNGTGNFIKGINGEPGHSDDRPVQKITVPSITLKDIYSEIGTNIDLLKLDIEGAEYLVLQDFRPIPKQITVETHEHCHKGMHDAYWPEIFERLCKDYHCTLHIKDWPQYLYMDCLFIRKDLR